MVSKRQDQTTVPNRRLFHSLGSKIVASFGILFVAVLTISGFLLVFGIPFTDFVGFYGRERDEVFRSLSLTADRKKERFVSWLAERKKDARFISDTSLAESSVKQLRDRIQEDQRRGTPPDLVNLESYKALDEYLQMVFGTWSAYHRIQVVDNKTGVIMYSTSATEVGSRISETGGLVKAIYAPQGISVEMLMSLPAAEPDLIINSIIPNRFPTDDDNDIATGVLRLFIRTDEFLKPLLYIGEGLGQTGDIVLVDQGQRILMPIKYPLPDGSAAKILEYQIKAKPAELAARGHDGITLAKDYRGVPVLAAYRNIMVTPDVSWGLVVKRDKSELFYSVWQRLIYSLAIGLAAMLGGLALIAVMTKRISRPLMTLSRTVSEIEAGNYSARAGVESSDEVGDLANAFNSMIERVENWHREMNEKVRVRTLELNDLNQALKVEMAEREQVTEELRRNEAELKSIFKAAPVGIGVVADHIITEANQGLCAMTGYSRQELLNQSERLLYRTEAEHEVVGLEKYRQISDKGTGTLETVWRRKDGEIIDVLLSSTPLDATDTSLGITFTALDITDRKRSQRYLSEAREQWVRTFDAIPDLVAIIDKNKRIVQANRALAEHLGLPKDQLSGQPCFGLVHRTNGPPAFCPHTQMVQDEKEHGVEMYEEILGGFFYETASPLLDSKGNLRGCVHVARNINQQKRTEEALRQSEEKYRLMFESSPLGVFHFDNTGTITACNDNFVAIIGSSLQKLIGLNTVRDLRDTKMIAAIEEALSGNLGHYEDSYTSVTARKTTPVKCEFAPIMSQKGTVLGGIGIVENVTERKRAEGALRKSEYSYRSVIENIEDVFYRSDAEGRLLMASPSGARLFGYDSVEEMIGLALDSFWVYPEGRQRLISIVKEQGKATDFEGVLKRKDGSTFVATLSTHFYRDDNGTILGTEGIIHDISDRKRIEAQLLQSQKMEAIGTLAGGIAHEVNNLLQVVLGHADMLLMSKGMDEKFNRSLEIIRMTARNGADLVKRILTFSRRAEPEKSAVNLTEAVRKVERILRQTIPRMIHLEMVLEENLRMISADHSQVEQILLNLAVNARDAMPEGGRLVFETKNVTIRKEFCRTHPEVKPGKYVLLTVSDTGQGMAKETLDRIFEPFFTTKQPGKGTGLGLSMIFGVVKSHGGDITCYSEVGVGSTFNIYFPASTEDLRPDDTATTIEMPAGGTETLLLVDDEDAVLTLGAEMLELAGYTVLTAANGQEALEIYQNRGNSISLVILDLVMPGISGRKCLEELLKMNPNAKVLIASGYAADGPAKEARESGAVGFVGKPFDMKRILLAVRKSIDGASTE